MKNNPTAINRYSLFPKSIAKSVEPLLKPIYKKHGFAEHRILTEWYAIVGRELASCSIPQKLSSRLTKEGGTLHVLVASGRALELQHMTPVIIDKIATYFGYNVVKKITFMQTGSAIFQRKKPEKSLPRKQVSKAVNALINNCADDGLRNALLSLGSVMDIR